MGPKQKDGPSKKNIEKKKESRLDDLTFGLKNKNKSSKVKQFINQTEKAVKMSNGGAERVKNII
jgi:hypothetical protein